MSNATPPQPNFMTFVSGIAAQTSILLGLIDNPRTGQRERDLPNAKYSIDLLQMISEKTAGNLTADERKFLDVVLCELRMAYVKATG